MKIRKTLLGIISVLGLSVLGINVEKVNVRAADAPVMEPSQIFNWTDNEASYVDEKGAHGIRQYNPKDFYENGIGIKQQLNVANGQTASVKFTVPYVNHETRVQNEGTPDLTKDRGEGKILTNSYTVYLDNVETGSYTMIRIFLDNTFDGTKTISSFSFIDSRVSGAWESYNVDNIDGVCTDGSSFSIAFDTTNYLQVLTTIDGVAKYVPISELPGMAEKKDKYLKLMKEVYGSTSLIEYWFAYAFLSEGKHQEVILEEVNGQSLKATNGFFNDTVAPIVGPIKQTRKDLVVEKDGEYTFKVEKYFCDPSTKTDFYVRPSTDVPTVVDELIRGSELQARYEGETEFKKVGVLDDSACVISKVSFDKAGKWEIRLAVTDKAGNTGYSPVFPIDVKKGFSIALDGEVPELGNVGEVCKLPGGIGTDVNDNKHEITVTVEDPIGNNVEVTNNSFIPQSQGIYYVEYSSSYEEGGKTINAIKVKREIIVGPALEKKGNEKEKKTGCNGSAGASVALVLSALFTLLSKKKNEKD